MEDKGWWAECTMGMNAQPLIFLCNPSSYWFLPAVNDHLVIIPEWSKPKKWEKGGGKNGGKNRDDSREGEEI